MTKIRRNLDLSDKSKGVTIDMKRSDRSVFVIVHEICYLFSMDKNITCIPLEPAKVYWKRCMYN